MPRGKSRFAAPLSLLFVAVLVFAPGDRWIDDRTTPDKDGRDIAARMLAPTLDEGLRNETDLSSVERVSQEKDKRGGRPVATMALLLATFFLALSSVFFLRGPPPRPFLDQLSSGLTPRRGPPLLQSA